MRFPRSSLAWLVGLTLMAPLAAAADEAGAPPPAKPSSCFQVSGFENWKAADAKTIYIRVNLNRYFRLDLSSTCPQLLWPGVYLVTKWHGSNLVCSPLDWDIQVAQNPGGVMGACIVKTMTALTPEEAAAIPKAFKP
ncbi:MAG: DUF6491 family protein [Rhizomicrobium sp.]